MGNKEHKASKGKIWKSKIDGAYLSDLLILGKEDSINNYEEVDPPVIEDDES
jgi:hypothetical protein|nr:MAG TPA: hypothetical protein [Caudoviricetes sp.]